MAADSDSKMAIVHGQTPSSVGNQDYTNSDLGGSTPVAALLFATGISSDSTTVTNGCTGAIGSCTSTTDQNHMSWQDEHGVDPTDCTTYQQRPADTKYCIRLFDDNGVELASGAFVSFISNGIRINWASPAPPTEGQRFSIILFAGTDVSAKTDIALLSNQNGETDVTTPGFEPDVVICWSLFSTSNPTSTFKPSWGFCKNPGDSGTGVQRCLATEHEPNSQDSDNAIGADNAYSAGRIYTSDGLYKRAAELTTFDANGFSLYTRLGNANGQYFHFLALKFGGATPPGVYVGDDVMPTSTGDEGFTGFGFKPQLVVQLACLETIDSGSIVGPEASGFSMGAFTPNDEFAILQSSEDAVAGNKNTASAWTSGDSLLICDDDGANQGEANFVSMDVGGCTLNFTAAPSQAGSILFMAIEEVLEAAERRVLVL